MTSATDQGHQAKHQNLATLHAEVSDTEKNVFQYFSQNGVCMTLDNEAPRSMTLSRISPNGTGDHLFYG